MRHRSTGRTLLAAGLFAGIALAILPEGVDAQEQQTVTAVPISEFSSVAAGEAVQGLIWRGGLELQSAVDTFGGLSGLGFTGPDGRLTMVSDRGNFVTGQLIYDETGRPLGLIGVRIEPIQNSRGADLPRAFARDAEALAVIERDGVPAALRVGFENLTRVADFQLVDSVPEGAATEIAIPAWLTEARTNRSLESVCVAPPASPVAGSTLLLTEDVRDDAGAQRGWLLGRADRGDLSYRSGDGTFPADCAFLPDGDLLVLERGVALLAFNMRLVRVAATDVRPGATMRGDVLLEVTGSDIDNMEGLAVHPGPDGETRITLVSDDNFIDWQRTLLLQFSLPDGP
ncbi:MAG TPA: esterase-like activity of phytase family protein [Devosiaceae bacterium]|jgi:hypothetical protein|nr:esterase-like activity of phytase family protein [Devosiaceae bacterium]